LWEEQQMRLPLFEIGQKVLVNGYVGVLAQGEAGPGAVECVIEAVRLERQVREEYDEATDEARRVVNYPDGWEYYLVAPPKEPGGREWEWGWTKEAELSEQGYKPTLDRYLLNLAGNPPLEVVADWLDDMGLAVAATNVRAAAAAK
jgi:hypothetical protein